jgi:MoaA/NifB/PqqE/SkfB family radical SAM enzyme
MVLAVRELLRTVGPATVSAAAKAKMFRRPTPLQIVFEVTHLCNLACEYCDRHTQLPNELALDEIHAIIREFAGMGMTGMTLDGGDPLVRSDIDLIIEELARLHLRIAINTNGILIPRKLESVKKAALVTVSLDGPERYHDVMRGEGSFEKAVRGIRAARDAGVIVKLRCTVHRENVDAVPQLVELAEDLDSPIAFQPALNSLFLDTDRDDSRWALDTAAFRRMVLWLCERKKRTKYIANHYASLKHFLSFPDYKEPPCSAGWIHATLDPQGYLYHCGQVNRGRQKISVRELGAKKAFETIARYSCGECWCASLVETNYIWGMQLGMFTPFRVPKPAATQDAEGAEVQVVSE